MDQSPPTVDRQEGHGHRWFPGWFSVVPISGAIPVAGRLAPMRCPRSVAEVPATAETFQASPTAEDDKGAVNSW